MKMKTTILSATAFCLGLVASVGIAGGGHYHKAKGVMGIQLTTASAPVTLVCTHGVRVSATKRRSGFVPFPPKISKLICDLWVVKHNHFIKVTDYGFRIQHKDQKVKVFTAGLPQSDNSKMIYQLDLIRWGSSVRIHFIEYGVKTKYSTYKKIQ